MAEILNTDFNTLPRATRERFVAITQSKAGPAPIFEQRVGGAGCAWAFLTIFFGLASFGIVLAGFGKPYTATQHVSSLVAYGLAFFLFYLGVLGLVRASIRKKALPFSPGVYVFATDTIVARDRNIKLLSAREITNVQPVHHHRNGSYTHTAFTLSYSDGTSQHFSVFGKPKAEAALQRLRQEGALAAEAMNRRDANVLYPIDPLFEARTMGFAPSNDPNGPLAKHLPGWSGKIALIALGLAAVLAPLTYGIRNLASDEVAYQVAESVYEYEAYLHGGWRHIQEVTEEFLPRAKLREAARKTDPAERIKAVQAIAAGKLVPSVRARADQELKAALHAAFEKASAAGTVAALREFQNSYPNADDVPAAKVRIHGLFQKTLVDFKPHASKADSIPFVEALLNYMERHDSPPLEVRFRRHLGKTMALADKVLAREAGKDGASFASATSHFEAKDAAAREGAVIAAIQKGFARVFPTDVLTLEQGEDLSPDDNTALNPTEPSIFVDYTVGWSGSTYTDPKEGRLFVGIVFDFDVSMSVPGSGTPLQFELKVLPPKTFTVSYNTFSNPTFGAAIKDANGGPSDSLVYEVMALRAFDQVSQKMQDQLFVSVQANEHDKPDAR